MLDAESGVVRWLSSYRSGLWRPKKGECGSLNRYFAGTAFGRRIWPVNSSYQCTKATLHAEADRYSHYVCEDR
jgi:hypothetical protein